VLNSENINGLNLNIVNNATEANAKRTNIINVVSDTSLKVEFGQSSAEAGAAAAAALLAVANDLQDGKIDAVITCPINKYSIQSESFNFPGHTEFFAHRLNAANTMMMMVGEVVKLGFATGHVPLKEVSKQLNKQLILDKLNVMNDTLRHDFVIRSPRIAVLSLNPHSGDDGLLGDEERTIIVPAVEKAKSDGILAFGPYSSDGFFAAGTFAQFDGVLAMYHDQGMIPFKSMSYPGGVNYTAGLPVVRTSPAHGTAYDLAGKGKASHASFRDAMFLAREIFFNRLMQEEINENPLKKQKESRY
jgi:4-hydroxythreonine-4-phosphate dehydrogenase